jgi:hypothetical protein
MAIFTSTSELEQQKQHRNFKKQTGWKAGAMAMMGHKATGEKNAFGKYLGGSPLMTLGAGIMSKDSDAEEVMKSQQAAEISHQIGVAKFVGEIYGAGAASGAVSGAGGASSGGGGLFGKAGTMGKGAGGGATKAGAFLSQAGGGSSQTVGGGGSSMFKEGTKASDIANSEAGKSLTNKLSEQGKQSVIDEMNAPAGDTLPLESEYTTEADAVSLAGGANVDPSVTSGQTKGMNTVSGATESLPLIGSATGLYAEKMAIADAYEGKRREIAGRTYKGSASRRV